MGKKLSAKSLKKNQKIHAKASVPLEPWSDDGTTKLLISFSNSEGSGHYFYSSALGGGEALQLCCLPGCNKENGTSLCTCYVSHPLNGLLCFHNGKEVSVINPTTGEIMTLPRSSLGKNMEHSSFLNAPYSVYSFGFDHTVGEYKIVHVYGIRHESNTAMLCDLQCEVFTLRVAKEEEAKEEEKRKRTADLWRKTKNVLPCPYMFKSQGVCVNGAIHWIGMNSTGEGVIICFDVATEKFRLLPVSFAIPYRASLSEIRGRLVIHVVEETDSVASLGLWILEDYEGLVWNKTNVGIANPKDYKGSKVYVLVGNDGTGDMLLTRKIMSERFDVIPFNGGDKIAGKRTVRIDGLPSWVDLLNGAKNLNLRIDNFQEHRVWLEPIVEKVEEEVQVEVEASSRRRAKGRTPGDNTEAPPSQQPPQDCQVGHGAPPPGSLQQNRPQGPATSHPQDGFYRPTPAYRPQPLALVGNLSQDL